MSLHQQAIELPQRSDKNEKAAQLTVYDSLMQDAWLTTTRCDFILIVMLLQVTKQCTDTNWRSLSLQWNACIVVGTLSLMVFLLAKFLTYCIAWHFFEFPKETSIESLVCLFTSYSTGLKLKCSTSFQNPENFSILIFILASACALA